MICTKCGTEVELPEGYKSPFITCPNCKNAIKIEKPKPVLKKPLKPHTEQQGENKEEAQSEKSSINFEEALKGFKGLDKKLDDDMVYCKVCRKPIPKNVERCEHCGELQDDKARALENEKDDTSASEAVLTFLDKASCWLCPIVTFIFGFIFKFIKLPIASGIIGESLLVASMNIVVIIVASILKSQEIGGFLFYLIPFAVLLIIGAVLKVKGNYAGDEVLKICGFYTGVGIFVVAIGLLAHFNDSQYNYLYICFHLIVLFYCIKRTVDWIIFTKNNKNNIE